MQLPERNSRVLIIDDNPSVHADARKILCPPVSAARVAAAALRAEIFGEPDTGVSGPSAKRFEVDSALQGQEGLALVKKAAEAGLPYALAFVDIRMPPGWDGVETIQELWKVAPDLQVVICTAHSEYSWEQMAALIGGSDRLLILKKPYDPIEVLQLASALTEKWRLARVTRAHAEELESRVRARTVALEAANESLKQEMIERKRLEAQFRQAQKMEAFGQLAGGIAHDFNNILSVVMAYSQVALFDAKLDSEVRANLEEIHAASQRAAGLIRQLLAFSSKQTAQLRTIDLNDAVADVAKMLHRIIGEDVDLQIMLAQPGLPVEADQGMIEQILMNLAVNARDAMPCGGRLAIGTARIVVDEARLRTSPLGREGDFAVLRVRDTGCGIAPEVKARIFEPFFTTKEPGKGTGLGLATVLGITQQHHGWIEVASEVGQGTSFEIYLPLARESAKPAGAKTEQPPERLNGSETVLLVEDEPAVRAMEQMVLERHGYRVFSSCSGAAALPLWRKHRDEIDALVTDIVMPDGVGGGDLAGMLKSEKPDLRVVFTSGHGPGADILRLAGKKGCRFLQKPFEPQALAKILRNCLDA